MQPIVYDTDYAKCRSTDYMQSAGSGIEAQNAGLIGYAMDSMGVGAIVVGGKIMKHPYDYGFSFSWFINCLLIQSEEAMTLFLECKMHIGIWVVAWLKKRGRKKL